MNLLNKRVRLSKPGHPMHGQVGDVRHWGVRDERDVYEVWFLDDSYGVFTLDELEVIEPKAPTRTKYVVNVGALIAIGLLALAMLAKALGWLS